MSTVNFLLRGTGRIIKRILLIGALSVIITFCTMSPSLFSYDTIKSLVAESLSFHIGRRVSIDSLEGHPLKYALVKNLKIESSGSSTPLNVKQLYLEYDPAPLWNGDMKLDIKTLEISGLFSRLCITADGHLELPHIIAKFMNWNPDGQFKISIPEISVRDSIIELPLLNSRIIDVCGTIEKKGDNGPIKFYIVGRLENANSSSVTLSGSFDPSSSYLSTSFIIGKADFQEFINIFGHGTQKNPVRATGDVRGFFVYDNGTPCAGALFTTTDATINISGIDFEKLALNVEYKDGRFIFRRVKGLLDRKPVLLSGTLSGDDIEITLAVKDAELKELATFFPGTLEKIEGYGNARITINNSETEGKILLRGARLRTTPEIQDLRGMLDISGSGRPSIEGTGLVWGIPVKTVARYENRDWTVEVRSENEVALDNIIALVLGRNISSGIRFRGPFILRSSVKGLSLETECAHILFASASGNISGNGKLSAKKGILNFRELHLSAFNSSFNGSGVYDAVNDRFRITGQATIIRPEQNSGNRRSANATSPAYSPSSSRFKITGSPGNLAFLVKMESNDRKTNGWLPVGKIAGTFSSDTEDGKCEKDISGILQSRLGKLFGNPKTGRSPADWFEGISSDTSEKNNTIHAIIKDRS